MINKTTFNSLCKLGVISLFVVSCSSGNTYKKPESFEEKISRYKSRNLNTNLVPEVQINENFNYKKVRNRAPASAISQSAHSGNLKQYNNKRLYFLALYSQYQTMRPFTSSKSIASSLNHCPSFHTSYLNYNESSSKSINLKDYRIPFSDLKTLDNQVAMANYPEFFLPVSKESTRPRVIDLVIKNNLDMHETKKLVKAAINTHLLKTYSELSELCETGSSSNYYVYENLITHIKTKDKLHPNKHGLNTLFKTTLFSNMALTNSIKKNQRTNSRGLASYTAHTNFDKEVINRLEVPWIEGYLHNR